MVGSAIIAPRRPLPSKGPADMAKSQAIPDSVGQYERASDTALRQLRKMIITLELAPGEAITEESLGVRLKCSRTPIREALQQLVREHLVVATPRRGVTVADLSLTDFFAMLEATEGIDAV